MIPIRLLRGGETEDVVVDVAGRSVGDVIAMLGVDNPTVDGRAVTAGAAAADVLSRGSVLGGPVDEPHAAAWELGVAAGPGSGHRFLLRPGRYPIGDGPSAAIRLPGLPDGGVTLAVDHLGWSVEGVGVRSSEAGEWTLLQVGSTWLTLRRNDATPIRRAGRVNRPPRARSEPGDRTVEIPEARNLSHRRREMRWAMFVGPVLIGGMMAIFFQPFFALFALLGPVMAAAGWIEDRVKIARSGKKQAAADAVRLQTYHDSLQRTGSDAARVERRRPGLIDAARIAVHADTRLWERRNEHVDAGSVVIGYGSAPLSPVPTPDDASLRDAALTATIDSVPIAVDLAPGRVLAVVDRHRSTHIASAIVAQFAVWRGPGDVRIAIVTDRSGAWEWTKWLPHVESDPLAGVRLLASERADVEAVVQYCRDTEEQVLLVVDVADPVALGLHHVLASPHVASVVTVANAASIPGSATQVVRDGALSPAASVGPIAFDPIVPSGAVLDTIALSLAGFEDPERRIVGSTIPATVALRSLYPACADAAALRTRWSAPVDGLRFLAGMGESGPLSLDLVADGPHALVAGTTGSGKSELLRTLVTSLASAYPPQDVNFVLVDYKGGSAFDACAALPHVAGVVTDLDGRLAERAKVSLEAELRRREHILRTRNAEDIVSYRRSGGSGLPRLVIVVDEFAALASDVPSFMDAVIDFAQRGRSLGVHLVLATQRPAGVVSEPIRANTNLRISLRVQSDHDARDVINDPAPASLPRHLPGRAYVRTGPGELRTFQTASVTCVTDRQEFAALPFRFSMYPEPAPAVNGGRDLDDIVEAIVEAGEGTSTPFRPWQPALPDSVSPADVASVGIGVGLEDQPERQSRTVWEWDPSVNLALVGTPHSGASETLAAIVNQTLAAPGGDDIGFYIIAGGGSTWANAASMSGVGDVIATTETSRLQRLVGMVTDEVEARRQGSWSTRIVVAVDGVEAVLRSLEREHATREALIALAANGPAVGVTMVIVANRVGALPTAMSAAVGRRLLFQLADPFEYAAVGLKADRQPANVRGRCVDPRVGHEIQMALQGLDEAGSRRRTWTLPAVEELPAVCKVTEVSGRLDLEDDDWFIPIGVGDISLGPVGWTLGPGEHALIIGSARTGKSTLLASFAEMLSGRDACVTVIAPRRSPLHELADIEVHAELTGTVADTLDDRSIVLVDDAFRVPPEALQALIAGRPDARIVATARPEDIRSGYTHWTKALRDLRTGVLLSPTNMGDGELIGAGLPRHLPSPHPGRGFLVSDGRVELCQTIYA